MVQTRRGATTAAAEEEETPQTIRAIAADSEQRASQDRLSASQTTAPQSRRQIAGRKRKQVTQEVQQPQNQRRPQTTRKKKQTKKDVYEIDDDDEDAAPPPEFFAKLARGKAGVSRKSKVVRRTNRAVTDQEGDDDVQQQLATEMSQPREPSSAQTIQVVASEQEDAGLEERTGRNIGEDEFEEGEEESGRLGDQSRSDVVNILFIDLTCPIIDYLESETEGNSVPATVFVKCEGLNGMIRDMGLNGWMSTTGEWASDLIRHVDAETEDQWATRQREILTLPRTWDLFRKSIELYQLCQDMPKGGDVNEQLNFVRQQDTIIHKTLDEIHLLTSRIQTTMRKLLERRSEQRSNQRPREWGAMFACIFQKLIPCLVMALREAYLLGGSGYRRVEDKDKGKPEQVNEEIAGRFMACTLQLPLRITLFIQHLYEPFHSYLLRNGPVNGTVAPKMSDALRISHKRRIDMNRRLATLHSRLMGGLKELKGIAEAPRRRRQEVKEDLQRKEAHEKAQQAIDEGYAEQMKRFIASTHAEPYNLRRLKDEYYAQHGWYMWEDERLLEMIRKVRDPNVEQLVKRVSTRRTVIDVRVRVAALRERMRLKYDEAEQLPPKWCYSP